MIETHPIGSRAEWLERRRQDVTASEVAALFGLHPYRTPLQVWLAKTGQAGGDAGDNAAMRRGRIMEPAVAAAVAEDQPEWRLERAAVYCRRPDLRLGSTPDYFAHDQRGLGVVECKTVAPETLEKWNGAPPLAYVLQVVAQMMTTGAAWGCVAMLAMTRSLDLTLHMVERHEAAEARIAAAVADFWAALACGEQPPARPEDAHALAGLYPRDDGSTLDLSGDNMLPELLGEREALKADETQVRDRIEAIDDDIKAKLGAAAMARLPGWRITWKTTKRAERVVPAGEYRVLRISRTKQEETTP